MTIVSIEIHTGIEHIFNTSLEDKEMSTIHICLKLIKVKGLFKY